ncbi:MULTISPECIES: hypothetical protein, partial [unclassified Microcoleus]
MRRYTGTLKDVCRSRLYKNHYFNVNLNRQDACSTIVPDLNSQDACSTIVPDLNSQDACSTIVPDLN